MKHSVFQGVVHMLGIKGLDERGEERKGKDYAVHREQHVPGWDRRVQRANGR